MKKKVFVKLYKSYRNVLAVCDVDLIGKKFLEGKRQLDVRDNFYRGEEVDSKRAIEIMEFQRREDSTFNIVGNIAVKIALEAGVIGKDNIGEVDGVKFALVLL